MAPKDIRPPMPHRAELQRVRALRDRVAREQQRRFLVQGPKLFQELVASSFLVEAVYATRSAAATITHPALHVVPDELVGRLGTLEDGNVLVAVVRQPEPSTFVAPEGDEVALALDGVADPGNLGTVIRVADWFGIRHIWCGAGCTDPFGPKAVQASMGSIFRVQVGQVDLEEAVRTSTAAGVQVLHAEMEGKDLYAAELKRPALVVMGSESHGISATVRAAGGTSITIPRVGAAESLNVAMAATCICSEFARRRATRQA